eukprot:g45704.t1
MTISSSNTVDTEATAPVAAEKEHIARTPGMIKTKELIIDFRKKGGEHTPMYINVTEIERVKGVKFLGVTITDDHVNATDKKAQQYLFFL